MFGNVTDNDTENNTDNGTGKGRMGLHKKRFLPEEKTIHFIQKRRTHYEKETFKRIT